MREDIGDITENVIWEYFDFVQAVFTLIRYSTEVGQMFFETSYFIFLINLRNRNPLDFFLHRSNSRENGTQSDSDGGYSNVHQSNDNL